MANYNSINPFRHILVKLNTKTLVSHFMKVDSSVVNERGMTVAITLNFCFRKNIFCPIQDEIKEKDWRERMKKGAYFTWIGSGVEAGCESREVERVRACSHTNTQTDTS